MAKQIACIVVTPDMLADLVTVFTRGVLDGATYTHGGKLSRSAIIRDAVKRGAESCAVIPPRIVALPERAGAADADRVKAARGKMTRAECARAAGLKDESSVRNVEARGMPLRGALLAWVVAREVEVTQ